MINNIETIINGVKSQIYEEIGILSSKWKGKTAGAFFNSINDNQKTFNKISEQLSSFSQAVKEMENLEKLVQELKTLMIKKDAAKDEEKERYQKRIDSKNSEIKECVKRILTYLSEVSIKAIVLDLKEIQDMAIKKGYIESGEKLTSSVLLNSDMQKEINSILDPGPVKQQVQFNVRTTDPARGTPFYTTATGNPYASANFDQCTCYAYGRFNEIASQNGNKLFSGKSFGNGGDFCFSNRKDRSNANAEGFAVTKGSDIKTINDLTPGDLLCWSDDDGGYGHVGIVESVKDGKIMISNGNARQFNMYYTDINRLKGFNSRHGYELKGVIHQTKN